MLVRIDAARDQHGGGVGHYVARRRELIKVNAIRANDDALVGYAKACEVGPYRIGNSDDAHDLLPVFRELVGILPMDGEKERHPGFLRDLAGRDAALFRSSVIEAQPTARRRALIGLGGCMTVTRWPRLANAAETSSTFSCSPP
jgi:hypothetical protein